MRTLILALTLIAPAVAAQTLQEARALFQSEQWPDALEAYQQITEREPENGLARYWLGRTHQQLGNDPEAIAALRQLEASGAPPIVQIYLAGSYARMQDADAAFARLDSAVAVGFANVALLNTEPLLEPLREEARFEAIVEGAQRNTTPCMYSEPFRQFDFWVGSWEVRNPQGQVVGTNEIELAEQGCFLVERWTGANGNTGTSTNYYDPGTGQWNQLWIAAGGSHTMYRGVFDDGAMRFEGTQTLMTGATNTMRMTFTPNEDGSVRQFIESSTDGGETWTPSFDGTYVRQPESP
ncbi:MAG: tetratricopeptide repeat protein [Bacteroidota bacterium]